jgi:type II secretory pathway pseudopilin PulG
VWSYVADWPDLVIIGISLGGILWVTSPAQRRRRRRRDARDRVALRRALRSAGDRDG